METGNILIGVISIVAIIIPFILMNRKSKSIERGLVKNLNDYAEKNNFHLDKWESIGNLALGIDQVNQIAYFTEVVEGVYETKHLNLLDYLICKVNREVREVDYHGEKDKITHSINIDFYPKNRKSEIAFFSLFDEDKNRMLSGEVQLANDWVERYNEIISTSVAARTQHKMAMD